MLSCVFVIYIIMEFVLICSEKRVLRTTSAKKFFLLVVKQVKQFFNRHGLNQPDAWEIQTIVIEPVVIYDFLVNETRLVR